MNEFPSTRKPRELKGDAELLGLAAELSHEVGELLDLAEAAWGVIANAGDWKAQSAEWQEAAAKWRERYHGKLEARFVERAPTSPTVKMPELLYVRGVPYLRGDVTRKAPESAEKHTKEGGGVDG